MLHVNDAPQAVNAHPMASEPHAWPRRRLARVGVTLVALSGVGAILSGLFPANTIFALHVLGALVDFVAAGLGVLLLGLATLRRAPALGAWSLGLGALTLAGFVLYNSATFLGLGAGGMERVAGFSPVIWANWPGRGAAAAAI
jgi:hypothetical membrane protein